jgi:hypothetical protein
MLLLQFPEVNTDSIIYNGRVISEYEKHLPIAVALDKSRVNCSLISLEGKV